MTSNPYEAPHDSRRMLARGPTWMIFASAGYFAAALVCVYLVIRCLMEAQGLIGFEFSYAVPASLFGRRILMTDIILVWAAVFACGSLFFAFLAFHQARSWSAIGNRPPVSNQIASRDH